jgi:hypothetical protein
MAQQRRDDSAQQQRDETARQDYKELRSWDEPDQPGTLSRAWRETVRVNLDLPTDALRIWQEATRANLTLVTETVRATLSLIGLYRRLNQ